MKDLTDTQIALLIKNALEYNAAIIALASTVYGQPLKERSYRDVRKRFLDSAKQYQKSIEEILKAPDSSET